MLVLSSACILAVGVQFMWQKQQITVLQILWMSSHDSFAHDTQSAEILTKYNVLYVLSFNNLLVLKGHATTIKL